MTDPPRSTQHRMKYHAALFALSLLILLPLDAQSQVLNQQVNALLANNCAGLGTGGFPTPNLAGLGPNLAALCNTPQTQGATSGGGGAASVQGSAVSILNTALLKRMEQLQAEEEEGGEKPEKPTSMRFNPLGLLGAAALQNLSVSSPFYATTSAQGGSSASFATSSQDRWKGLGFFATGQLQALNRNVGSFQDGYDSTIYGVTVGTDYRLNNRAVVGIAGNYANTDGSFTGGGTFSTNSYTGLAFASIQPTDNTFIQLTAGYTRNNYLVNRIATALVTSVAPGNDRSVVGSASSNSNGNVINGGILTGYDHSFGRFTFGPRLGVNYTNTHISSYSENGSTGIELQYNDQYINSLQSLVGIYGSAAFSTQKAVLVPQFNADYIHEFANSQRFINVQFVEDQRANPTRFAFQNDGKFMTERYCI